LTEPSKILSSDGNPIERPIFRGRWDSYAACVSNSDQVLVLPIGYQCEDDASELDEAKDKRVR
jgi:hypothetical protein